MSKVVFLTTAISRCGWNSWLKNEKDFDGMMINHGITHISANIPKEHNQSLINLKKCKSWDDYASQLRSSKPDWLLINMYSMDYDYCVIASKIAKKLFPEIKIVVGGIHPSVMPDECLEIDEFDYIFKGEGEVTLPELIKDNGHGFDRFIVGVAPDLDKLPYENRDIYPDYADITDIMPLPTDDMYPPYVDIISARGCPYSCTFCAPSEQMVFGKKVRQRSLQHVLGELNMLYKRYRFNTLTIHDDMFTLKKDYIMEFCDMIEMLGWNIKFQCQSRADFVAKNPDIIKRMREVGLNLINIGFESGSQKILDFYKKGTKVEDNYECARILHENGIHIFYNVMFCAPTETKEDMLMTSKLIKDTFIPKFDHLSPSVFTPIPGSYLFDYCIKEKLIEINYHLQYVRYFDSGRKIRGTDYESAAEIVKDLYKWMYERKDVTP